MEKIDEIGKNELKNEFDQIIAEKDKLDIEGLDFSYCGTQQNKDEILFNEANNNNIKKGNSKKKDKSSKNSDCHTFKTQSRKDYPKDMCHKCFTNKSQYFVRQEYICKDCFTKIINHRFRSNLRAHCRIRHEDNLLVAISGGINSMCMFHLFNLSLNDPTSTKKMFFKTKFLFVDDSFFYTDYRNNKNKELVTKERETNLIILNKLSNKYQFEIIVINLEKCFNLNNFDDLESDFNSIDRLFDNLSKIKDVNFINKYIDIITRNTICSFSVAKGYNKLVLGCSQTSTVNNIFSNLVEGRGSQISINYVNEISFPGLTVLYPMIDFLDKEVLIINRIYNLEIIYSSIRNLNVSVKNKKLYNGDHSLLISNFLSKLQEKSFSTLPTIISTAEKLVTDLPKFRCEFCLNNKDDLVNEMEIGSIDEMKNENM